GPEPGASRPSLERTPPSPSRPYAGWRLVTRLTTSPVLETWQALDRDGRPCQAKVIFGFVQADPQAERTAIARLASLAHPTLVPLDVAQYDAGRLTLLTEAPGRSLRERFQDCQA